jgi:hypothetical protein
VKLQLCRLAHFVISGEADGVGNLAKPGEALGETFFSKNLPCLNFFLNPYPIFLFFLNLENPISGISASSSSRNKVVICGT